MGVSKPFYFQYLYQCIDLNYIDLKIYMSVCQANIIFYTAIFDYLIAFSILHP